MATAWDYISAVGDRFLLLVAADQVAAARFPESRRSRPNDPRPFGVYHKPQSGVSIDFPELELVYTDGTDRAYDPDNPEITLAIDDGDADPPYAITQNYLFRIVHQNLNKASNAQDERTLIEAFRRGRRQLWKSGMTGAALPYVLGWGPVTITRRPEWIKEGARDVSLITIPVRIEADQSELAGA